MRAPQSYVTAITTKSYENWILSLLLR